MGKTEGGDGVGKKNWQKKRREEGGVEDQARAEL